MFTDHPLFCIKKSLSVKPRETFILNMSISSQLVKYSWPPKNEFILNLYFHWCKSFTLFNSNPNHLEKKWIHSASSSEGHRVHLHRNTAPMKLSRPYASSIKTKHNIFLPQRDKSISEEYLFSRYFLLMAKFKPFKKAKRERFSWIQKSVDGAIIGSVYLNALKMNKEVEYLKSIL